MPGSNMPVSSSSPAAVTHRRFLFLLCSARREGNTEVLARIAAARLPSNTKQEWIWLHELSLAPFEDIRHEGEGSYPAPENEVRRILESTLAATDLVFVAPLYWYGLPASAKLYLDYWSGWLRPPVQFKPRMKGKTMWAISVYSEDDPQMADSLFQTLRRTASYMGMRWGGNLLGRGNRPGDVLADHTAVAHAEMLFAPR